MVADLRIKKRCCEKFCIFCILNANAKSGEITSATEVTKQRSVRRRSEIRPLRGPVVYLLMYLSQYLVNLLTCFVTLSNREN
jgi:hypothetical protein